MHCIADCPGLWLHDAELFNCVGACLVARARTGTPALLQRLHIHNTEQDLMKAFGAFTLEDSFLEDEYFPLEGAHNDAIQGQGQGGQTGGPMLIRRNRIEGPCNEQNASIIMKTDFGDIDRITAVDNLFSGGDFSPASNNIQLSCGSPPGCGGFQHPTNMEFRRNEWVDACVTAPVQSELDNNPVVPTCFIWEINTNTWQTAGGAVDTTVEESTDTGDCWDETIMPGNPDPPNPEHGLRGGGLSGGTGLSEK